MVTCREALFTPIPTFPRQGGRGFAKVSSVGREEPLLPIGIVQNSLWGIITRELSLK